METIQLQHEPITKLQVHTDWDPKQLFDQMKKRIQNNAYGDLKHYE